MSFIKNMREKVLNLLYPPRCMFCDEVLPEGKACKKCQKRMAPYRLEGERGEKAGMTDKTLGCLDAVSASFRYADEVKEAVIRYKFFGEAGMAYDMARIMTRDLKKRMNVSEIDYVVSVPEHKDSDRHSRLLAKQTARILEKKYFARLLVKTASTRKQHDGLTRAEREKNLRGVFAVSDKEKLKGKTVLICDDIVTSGCTLNECARTLKKAGARAVFASAFSSTFIEG